jgi:hypothetical protein
MKILGWIGKGALAILVLVAILLALNWIKISNLLRVNSLFAEDKIVYNFSHMNEILPADKLTATGPTHQWPEAKTPINESWSYHDADRSVAETLTE